MHLEAFGHDFVNMLDRYRLGGFGRFMFIRLYVCVLLRSLHFYRYRPMRPAWHAIAHRDAIMNAERQSS